ncbi:DUF4199 domain-containing protein [Psychroflexus halocasei]|nr:DUF4199 domain-containing protein [Psychroflexus halocasei]
MKNFRIEFKWAMFYTLLNFLWLYAEKAFGWHSSGASRYAVYSMIMVVPQVAVTYFNMREKSEKFFDGNIEWRKAFFSGVVLSVLIAALSPVIVYALTEFVSPDFVTTAIEQGVGKGMEEDSAKSLYNMNSLSKQAMFGNLATGVFWSAILALFFKKK